MRLHAAALLFVLLTAAPFSFAYADPNDYYDDNESDSVRDYDFSARPSYAERDSYEESRKGATERYYEEQLREDEMEDRIRKEREEAALETRRYLEEKPERFDPLKRLDEDRRADTHEIDDHIRNPHKRIPSSGEIVSRMLTETR